MLGEWMNELEAKRYGGLKKKAVCYLDNRFGYEYHDMLKKY